ncbi:hypothetical protein KUTeg_001798 [Tegillarca granosa]|uniref:Uncharacterized protein n=1 Tax=Tegillarca granosa TaxID=220873 RepID=A0ABQ9FSG8_TEGGR|nr:hypothetical protein KUTeg_001798 [Tegillarca granosa]
MFYLGINFYNQLRCVHLTPNCIPKRDFKTGVNLNYFYRNPNIMEKALVFAMLFVVVVKAAVVYEDIVKTVNMDQTAECGTTQHVSFKQTLQLQSTGSSPDGQCKVSVHAHPDEKDDCENRILCVKVAKSKMNDCETKLVFSEQGGRYPASKELRCRTRFSNEWCTLSHTLNVELMEMRNFTANMPQRDYSFTVNIAHGCAVGNDLRNPDQEAGVTMNRIYGILTGVACCCIFLVMLIISFCCFRNKSWRSANK